MSTEEILSGLPLWAKLPYVVAAEAGVFPQWDGTKWVAVGIGGDVGQATDNNFTGNNTFTNRPLIAGANAANVDDLAGYASLTANNQRFRGTNQIFDNTINLTSGLALAYQTAPAGAANFTTLYATSTGMLSWRNGTGFTRSFDAGSITANRTWSMPDANTTLAGLSVTQTFTAAQSINLANSSALTDFTINPTVKTSGNLFAFSVNGSSRATLSSTGVLTVASHVNSSGDITTSSSTGQLKINDTKLGRGGADGIFVMMNNAENGFSRLCFGGITSSFSAIKSNGATIDFVLANDAGGWANIRAGLIQAASTVRLAASTASVASLNIPVGAAMTSHADGNVWLEADGTLYIRIGGVSKRFTLS